MFACSGPGAGAAIAKSVEIGYTHAAIAAAMLAASIAMFAIGRRGWGFPAAFLGLLTFHPAWTVSVSAGDCGFLQRDASYLVTGLGSLILMCDVGYTAWVVTRRARPEGAGDYDEGHTGSVLDGRGGPDDSGGRGRHLREE